MQLCPNRPFSVSTFAAAPFVLVLLWSPILQAQEAGTTAPTEQKAKDKPSDSDSPQDEPGDKNGGQSDLDEATVARIDAQSEKEMETVAALLESALRKGLDDENSSFAKKMLGSVLLQQSQRYAAGMMQARGRQQIELRDKALAALEEAVANDPSLVEAFLMMARLNLLPGGEKDAVAEATSKAIELLKDDPIEQSAALVLRALTQDDNDLRMADLNAAAEADPNNTEAFQARAALRLQMNDVEGAIVDLEKVLLKDPTNQAVAGAAVQKLVDLNRVEDAMALITKMLAAKPSEGMYRMRAILYRSELKFDEALSDLNKAIAIQPKDPMTLLQRAELALDRDDVKAAKADFRAALKVAPQIINVEATIALRSRIALQENRLADAINDAQLLLNARPDDIFRRLRLGTLYSLDNRPRKAIDIYSSVLQEDPKNAAVLRTRGDALLSVGDHSAAVDDYERAIESLGNSETDADERTKAEAAGINNNLAWVLATSPTESVRDGKKAEKYAIQAAKLSDYAEAHILSTLAAAYAENGNFKEAVKWSKKAVELGEKEDHEQIEQLEAELKSYEDKKPWREKQETEENAVPILSAEDLIDT
ncbi:tetratricopeptide repeat protein [Rubripirellula sp.]|nr:tetratricopeptide repeat protein [Rubripirellula sp.]MDB4644786.1 tetratricopeptide repeat protein [Rubripirellula sp.]